MIARIQRQAYHRTVLPNGLRVVSAPRIEAESVAIGVWMNVGGRYENRRTNGISHYLEHMLFKGSRRYSSRAIKEAIEGVGGVINAFTDEEFTCVLAKVQPKAFPQAVEVLTDMVLSPTLEPKEVEKERSVIIEEIRMYRDLPMQSVHDLLNGILWPDHPLGLNLAGTEKSVSRIRRREILQFQRSHYTPRNIVIAACGKIDHRNLLERVSALWSRVRPGKLNRCARVRQGQRKPRTKLEVKETEQTHLCVGFHAFPRNHPQIQALNLLNVVLGGNMSSRLFQEVREKRGLAYEITSQVKRFRDTGLFSVSAGVEHAKLVKCLEVILQQILRMRRDGATVKEFEQAREYLVGQILFASEDTVEQMCWMGESEMLLGRVEPVESVLGSVARVRRGDLKAISRRLLVSERMNLAVIGPVKGKTTHRIEKLLGVRR